SGRKFHRSLYAGDSYLSQSTKTLHFGLGKEMGNVQVYVVWPDGGQQSFTDLQPGSVYQLTQGKPQAEAIAQQQIERFAQLDPAPLPADSSSSRRAVLVDRLPLAAMPLPSYDNPKRIVNSLAGKPLLITLWGTTCANCLKELNDFHEHAAEFAALGLTIVPMCSDEMSAGAKAKKLIAGMGFGGEIAGPTDERWLGMMQMVFMEIFGPNAPSVLPTSLLLDPHGRICVVYQGPVSLEILSADVERLKNSALDNRFTGILTGGQWLARRFRDFPGLAGAMRQNGYPLMADFFEQIAAQTGQKPR
ncbi:MAG: ASPIC/UnbV domain-containing protein, partial [Planctomycetes bacterium]|nr:ASPIC/UnbV domain-containing protein [Planctomycetota bacterium]